MDDYVNNWFATVALVNMIIGLNNAEKNKKQESKQNEIDRKLDKIIDLLERINDEH